MSDELREELHKASIEAVALKLDWSVDEAGFYPVPDDVRRVAIEAILPLIARERAAALAEAAEWARACSGESADNAAAFIEEIAAIRAAGTETGEKP